MEGGLVEEQEAEVAETEPSGGRCTSLIGQPVPRRALRSPLTRSPLLQPLPPQPPPSFIYQMSAIPSSRLPDAIAHPLHYTIMLPPFLTLSLLLLPLLHPIIIFQGAQEAGEWWNGDANVQFIPFDKSSHGDNPIWKQLSRISLQ